MKIAWKLKFTTDRKTNRWRGGAHITAVRQVIKCCTTTENYCRLVNIICCVLKLFTNKTCCSRRVHCIVACGILWSCVTLWDVASMNKSSRLSTEGVKLLTSSRYSRTVLVKKTNCHDVVRPTTGGLRCRRCRTVTERQRRSVYQYVTKAVVLYASIFPPRTTRRSTPICRHDSRNHGNGIGSARMLYILRYTTQQCVEHPLDDWHLISTSRWCWLFTSAKGVIFSPSCVCFSVMPWLHVK